MFDDFLLNPVASLFMLIVLVVAAKKCFKIWAVYLSLKQESD